MVNVSLETAKKLVEAGVKLETDKWWGSGYSEEHIGWIPFEAKLEESKAKNSLGFKPLELIYPENPIFRLMTIEDRYYNRYGEPSNKIIFYPAPSTDELLEILPEDLSADGSFLTICKLDGGRGYSVDYGKDSPEFLNKDLSESLAQMILYLTEHGYELKEGKLIKENE